MTSLHPSNQEQHVVWPSVFARMPLVAQLWCTIATTNSVEKEKENSMMFTTESILDPYLSIQPGWTGKGGAMSMRPSFPEPYQVKGSQNEGNLPREKKKTPCLHVNGGKGLFPGPMNVGVFRGNLLKSGSPL